MLRYAAFTDLERFLFVTVEEVYPDGYVDPLGYVDEEFPAPGTFVDADKLLAEQGYFRREAWTVDPGYGYLVRVVRD